MHVVGEPTTPVSIGLKAFRNLIFSHIHNILIVCYPYRACLDLSELDLSRFEAQQCCVENHGFLAEPASQEEHDLIKQHLVISELHHLHFLPYIVPNIETLLESHYSGVCHYSAPLETLISKPNKDLSPRCLT